VPWFKAWYKGPMLDEATIEALDREREIDIVTPRRDGSRRNVPIWVVVVEGEAYVRSWLGERGAWYRRARKDGRAAIEVDGSTIDVALEAVDDEEVNERVSDAFRSKYGARSPKSTEEMVTGEAPGTTLRLT
jgi:hypothetical protein